MSILQTLQWLVVGLEGKAEVLNKAITTKQWSLFEIIYDFHKTTGPDLISENLPVLNNFISYVSELESSDQVISCKLADSMLLCLGPRVDQLIPIFLGHTMKIIHRGITNVEPVITKPLLMHLLEVVLNLIYHNPRLTIILLVKNGWSNGFFGEWFSRLDCFKRTDDKKLTVLPICSILGAGFKEGGDCLFVQSSGGQLLIGALKLFQNLPQSIKRLYELEMEYSNNDSDGSVDEDDFGIGTLEGLVIRERTEED
ncbi:hypothetical protein PPACK8108_LOCUS8095 [Phakopsora pachyrhizi]|uniref:Uncharacterized protein n=1 Tax=Phakopsora pachyrhizi TaxID=170000 RepID=A0AAV0AU37_PHAPC|nr:hypothetical protein PPACK8108_LOCUS8095 [Phakopsora pachyrhizi]